MASSHRYPHHPHRPRIPPVATVHCEGHEFRQLAPSARTAAALTGAREVRATLLMCFRYGTACRARHEIHPPLICSSADGEYPAGAAGRGATVGSAEAVLPTPLYVLSLTHLQLDFVSWNTNAILEAVLEQCEMDAVRIECERLRRNFSTRGVRALRTRPGHIGPGVL